ncbi:MAG: hypothetical protein JST80_08105 [Bdellovibrionales bacterium]|nr:hypothetical protein [Bdellovibrionales bacterium]
MNSLLQQKDWPGLVLLLKPKEGQNFDHDLILSKAYIQLERRPEAQKLLNTWLDDSKYAELAKKQLDLVSNIFFSQETSNLYFDAVRLISIRKWAEAKDRLDQAIVKEPGNILLISRLVQVDIQLGLKDAAAEQLKVGLDLNPNQNELSVFSARLALDDEEERDAQRTLLNQKSWIFEHELPTIWYFDSLQSLKRSSEILTMQKGILKSHPNWAELRVWLLKNGLVPKDQIAQVKTQIEELFKDPEKFNQTQESEYRKGQYYWISNNSIDQLKTMYIAATAEKHAEKPMDKPAEKSASTNP